MKKQFLFIFLSGLLLITISYVQILHKVIVEEGIANTIITECGEEPNEKSAEENSRETDQDEDSFKLVEIIALSAVSSHAGSRNLNYSFGLLTHYPEIVSPPPQS